jgi:undecaprenyl-diphosphatase
MEYIYAFFLGVLQGVTEFLPVSSSGHLSLLEHAFGFKEPETFFDVSLHAGTLLAVLVFFRSLVLDILSSIFRCVESILRGKKVETKDRENAWLIIKVLVASIPTGVVGSFFGDAMEGLSKDAHIVSILLIVNGGILLLNYPSKPIFAKNSRNLASCSLLACLAIGVVQAIAILRGISRSGSTITAGNMLGLKPEDSARFSFLLFLVAVSGAVVLEIAKSKPSLSSFTLGQVVLGAVVAFMFGVISLKVLMRVLASKKLYLFAPYCIVIGLAGLLLL